MLPPHASFSQLAGEVAGHYRVSQRVRQLKNTLARDETEEAGMDAGAGGEREHGGGWGA